MKSNPVYEKVWVGAMLDSILILPSISHRSPHGTLTQSNEVVLPVLALASGDLTQISTLTRYTGH